MKTTTNHKFQFLIAIVLILSSTNVIAQLCPSNGRSTNDEYIGRVRLNTIDNSSGPENTTTVGYSDFKYISTNLIEGQTYTIRVNPTWTGTVYREGYRAWIDFNGNNAEDTGEMILNQTRTYATEVSATFTVPNGVTPGSVIMRVSMKYNGRPTFCESFRYGEVEDYTINLVASTPDPEINIKGSGINISNGDSTPSTSDNTNFGSTNVSGSVLSNTFTIENLGNADLTIGSITFSGTNAADFSVTSAPAATVSSSGSTSFIVTFDPSGSGTRTAVISIPNNDSDENPYTFALQGSGVAGPPEYTAYFENFDADNGGWTVVTSTNDTWLWTNSLPASNEIVEGNVWRSDDFNNYRNSTDIVVESPTINLSGLENLTLSLDVKYETESNYDGMRILYSINGGAFTVLGASGQGTNWYEGNVSALGSDGWNNTSHPSNAPGFSPYSQFINASIDLDDGTFSNQSNVKFRIQFKSDNSSTADGVAFDNFLIKADPMTALNDNATGPANITDNLRLWLKSNAGISAADGAALNTWEDQAYDTTLDKEDATASNSLAPTYYDNATNNMNFNPIAKFNNSNQEYMQGKGGYYSQDYFVVVRSDDIVNRYTGSTNRQFAIGARYSEDNFHEDPTGLAFGSSTARYSNEVIAHNVNSFPNGSSSPPNDNSYGRAYTSSSDSFKNVLIINAKANTSRTALEIYKNGKQIDNTTGKAGNGQDLNYKEFNNANYFLGTGRSGLAGRSSSQLNGDLAEVICYTSPNSAINQQKILSYLGIKYGVTLQDVASGLTNYRLNDVDYIDSNGIVIWDTSANTGYNYDIAGIGRDDASNLNQKQSKSQNYEVDGTGPTSGFVTIALTDIYDTNNENITNNTNILNNGEFLVWGNNGVDVNLNSAVISIDISANISPTLSTNVSFTAMQRIWKIVEKGGNVGTVKVQIDTLAIRNVNTPGAYLLLISDTPTFDTNSSFRFMAVDANGNASTTFDFDDTKYFTFGFAPEVPVVRSVYFDGVDHHIDLDDALDLNPTEFTISTWVKRGVNSPNKSILSKRDTDFDEGYDLKIDASGNLEMSWMDATSTMQSITSNTVIPQDEWHHIALIYTGGNATFYIDGVLDKTTAMTAPVDNNLECMIGAADEKIPTAFFEGHLDEMRVWDTALSIEQLRYIMNQEILGNSNLVNGKIIPNAITRNEVISIPWSNLAGYYPFSTFTYIFVKDESSNQNYGDLRHIHTIDRQTAPLPYETASNGDWDTAATWLNSNVQPLPNALSIVDGVTPIDWNIVKTSHNINSGDRDIKVLGLISNSGEITIADPTVTSPIENNDGQSLTVTHYLELDGSVDLVGESQLIQEEGSILDQDSGGFVERDQQGTQSSYNYNYWASSVSQITSGTGTNGTGIASTNASYPISGILSDATSSDTPQAIDFQPAYYAADGATSNPTISTYWLWKFNGTDNDYASWVSIDENSLLLPGEGFTMKGTSGAAAITDLQNYLFKGKPNNGTITLPVSLGNDRLIGNPYPSAIDANEFILDNISDGGGRAATNIINGALYYWHHFSGATHVLGQYVGGYATYTLMGGVQAYANDTRINNTGEAGGRVPERYIPVNQGFFVVAQLDPAVANTTATVTGGNVVFKNSQRVFKREGSTGTNTGSLFFKATNKNKTINASKETENEEVDGREKIRLLYSSASGYYRELLVGKDENTTRNFDLGYDAPLIDPNPADMFWLLNDVKFVIQAVPYFDETVELPIGLTVDEEGLITIKIKGLENLNEATEVYLKDALTQQEVNLLEENFEISLAAGAYVNRFTIVFKTKEIVADDETEENINPTEALITAYMNNDARTLHITNNKEEPIRGIRIFNSLGQATQFWNKTFTENKITLPAKYTTGVYIIQISTDTEITSKKVIVE